ncbi:uncharacterized protein EV422DRAFT_571856 [Fimicolochytrium jonesii]|uniref:uncharacterized protein n=1 Tax=Fimicolochytrium jonesii TaxID=1396493 RepID=UPI0022FEC685|nr:uncharacterized protein EV422DRAFT_571856 [Fimicolochytrium jonesii]KAI8816289.1 hypothetical protein EV422DRAFT_571856 [Fimicolochytrium jonesii]
MAEDHMDDMGQQQQQPEHPASMPVEFGNALPQHRTQNMAFSPESSGGDRGSKRARSMYLSHGTLPKTPGSSPNSKRSSYTYSTLRTPRRTRDSKCRVSLQSVVSNFAERSDRSQCLAPSAEGWPTPSDSFSVDNSSLRSNSAIHTSFASEDVIYPTPSKDASLLAMTDDATYDDDDQTAMDEGDFVGETVTPSISITSCSRDANEKRLNIVREILDTERRYVDSLSILQKMFLQPLMAAVGTSEEMLSKKMILGIFSELPGIINVNSELKKQLENRLESSPWDPCNGFIGDIFLNLAPYLKMYSSYVKNFNNALSRVTECSAKFPAFSHFIAKQHTNPELKGLRLESFLIMPVQRIPRYKMLLEELVKKTDVHHPDHETLKNSLERIAEVAVFVNEAIREHEMVQELIALQGLIHGMDEELVVPGRRLIRRGTVQKISRKRHHTRYLILLSDALIYASPGILDDYYVFHRKLDLELCEVVDVPDTPDMRNIFQIVSPDKSFAMYVDTREDKQGWIDDIGMAVQLLTTNRSTLRNELGRDNSIEKRRKMEVYSAPVWMPDDSTNNCMLCSQEFSMLKRKHHCRACGNIVCYACSSRYFIIPSLPQDKLARACDPCYERISIEGKLQVVQSPHSLFPTNYTPSPPAQQHDYHQQLQPQPQPRQPRNSSSTTSSSSSSTRRQGRPTSMVDQLWHVFGKGFADKNSSKRSLGRPFGASATEDPFAPPKHCSLCLDLFSWTKWRYLCTQCKRTVCASCTPKAGPYNICDPCYLNVDPADVVVDPKGGGWSASHHDHAMMETT